MPDFKINEFAFTGISKDAYDRVNRKIAQTYGHEFAAHGCPLIVHDSWSKPDVNAQAWQEDGFCHVEIFGGLARMVTMTENSTLEVGFHEVGHHLGGPPYYDHLGMSCEGQADYFATAEAMPKAGRPSKDASLRLVWMLADINGLKRPRRPLPKLPAVKKTYCYHPEPPCRLATYDAGRLGLERPNCWFKP